MTIRDMIESGIEMQGTYSIRAWELANEDAIYLWCGNPEHERIPEEHLDYEIDYIYPSNNTVVIELEGR